MEFGVAIQVQRALMVDIPVLLCLNNTIEENIRESVLYQEALTTILSPLERIRDTLQSKPPLTQTEANSTGLESIKRDLEVTMNAVKTLVLKEVSILKSYQQAHQRFQELISNNIQTSPRFSHRPSCKL
ncbi:hypothetical protein CPB83DRAFT_900510 [Crepidotus variabilis]|uniref:Uncharacterized protein n=1 Tax=Crepidotus variabilis TaxID=179855 RepID=A0A9P6E324_9AGAR|nr:hypothetical protein CPB83DRAFT_900510 [Crepidotus variabilis]